MSATPYCVLNYAKGSTEVPTISFQRKLWFPCISIIYSSSHRFRQRSKYIYIYNHIYIHALRHIFPYRSTCSFPTMGVPIINHPLSRCMVHETSPSSYQGVPIRPPSSSPKLLADKSKLVRASWGVSNISQTWLRSFSSQWAKDNSYGSAGVRLGPWRCEKSLVNPQLWPFEVGKWWSTSGSFGIFYFQTQRTDISREEELEWPFISRWDPR